MSSVISTTLSKAISSLDGFHHLVYSISGTTHTLFLDNSAIAVNISGGNVLTNYQTISNLFFGIAGDLSYGYTGYLDDVKVFNRALTTTDVNAIYTATPSVSGVLPIVLMAFTNSSGSVTNTGSLGNSITSTVSTTGTNLVGPNGTTSVYRISGTSNTLTNFGTLYNFTVSWWQKWAGGNATSIYLGNTTYGSRLMGTNNINNSQNSVVIDGSLTQSGTRIGGITAPYNFNETINTWYHYAIVCNLPVGGGAGTVTYYQNGGATSYSFSYSNYINGFQSFFYFPDNANLFYFYKLSVYNSALSLEQIQTLYAQK